MEHRRVVITGIGTVAPGAKNSEEFLELLKEGRSGIKFSAEQEEYGFECQVAGKAESGIDLNDPILKYHEVQLGNDFIQLACTAALEAWKSAGLDIPEPDSEVDYRTGVVIGGITPGTDVIVDKVAPLIKRKKVRRLGSQIVPNVMPSGASAYLSSIFAAGAYSYSLNSACSTGTDSIINGAASIWLGFADRMIVGASEHYSPYNLAGFDSMRLMNKQWNHEPERASRPLSNTAHGFVPGSGAGILILEAHDVAIARGAKIYGEIIGSAVNCGAQRGGGTMTYPNKDGVIRALNTAMGYSQLAPTDIDYINGHLSGTVADVLEISNWRDVLKLGPGKFPPINSTKALIGHCLGAAGALEFNAMVLQVENNFIHQALNTEDIHPEIEGMIGREAVPMQRLDKEINIAAKASFGFGDVNSVIIYKKWKENA